MDNLTHTLAGAALGEAGLKRLSGLGMAALMIGANLPDVDALAIPAGAGLTFRRGWTHGPLGMLVLPVLLTAALVGYDRWQRRRGSRPAARPPVRTGQLLLLAYAGVLSHPALDWLNTYGIRLLMPFSETWFYGDSIFIIDPWIWLALGIGVIVSRRRGRKLDAAGAPKREPHGAGPVRPARVALAAVAVYVAAMLAGSRHAHDEAVRHFAEEGEGEPLRVMAGPVPLNPLQRELIFDLGDHYRFGSMRLLPDREIIVQRWRLPTNLDHPSVRRSMETEEIQGFLYWSRFPYFVVEEDEGAVVVRAADARFSRDASGWPAATVRLPSAAACVGW
jgi:inner membrane protein